LGGASSQAWNVAVESGSDRHGPELFLKLRSGDGRSVGNAGSIEREAEVCRALTGTGIPVPGIVGASDRLGALLMTRMVGTSVMPRDGDERDRVAGAFMSVLAALHRVGTDRLEVPCLRRPVSPNDSASDEVARWRDFEARTLRGCDPLVVLALAWLGDHAPRDCERLVVVHGDAGPGNFLHSSGEVSAVLDWELAHLGDPMEDLAWISVRSMIEPFGDFALRLAEYERAGGATVRPDAIHFFQMVALTCSALNLAAALRSPDPEMDPVPLLAFEAMHRRLLCRALARVLAIDPASGSRVVATDHEAAPRRRVLERLVVDAEERSSRDGPDSRELRSAAKRLRFLANEEQMRMAAEERELDDLASVLGARPTSVENGRSILASEIVQFGLPDVVELEHIVRSLGAAAEDQMEMRRPIMGRLADARLPIVDEQ